MTSLPGSPSDDLPDVQALGATDVGLAFVSMSARHSDGLDEDYLAWHALDHRPEQYRLAGIRHALRLVSTPECRAARAASDARYDAVDHVMAYFFTDPAALGPFAALGAALGRAGRMPLRLPSVEVGVFDLAGKVAAPESRAGADVVAWRPLQGTYLLIESGQACPEALVEVAGVAGVWWLEGAVAPAPFDTDHRGLQLSWLFLDDDPVAVAGRLRSPLEHRWAHEPVEALLAAPFREPVPFAWGRHLPA